MVVVFCVVSAILSLVLRQYKPEYAVFISLACSIIVVLYLMDGIAQVGDRLQGVFDGTLIAPELIEVVFKSLGVCILAELAGQVCKDAGEQAIASKIELAGKVALLFLSMPLFLKLLDTAAMLLSL